ncbi:MAG: hypothetical protein DYH03_20100 [Nitrospira sp. NTP1]|nr:hypothetical protein [Nitrospira sp. NTP1]
MIGSFQLKVDGRSGQVVLEEMQHGCRERIRSEHQEMSSMPKTHDVKGERSRTGRTVRNDWLVATTTCSSLACGRRSVQA